MTGYLETVTSKATASVPENTSKQPPVIVPPEEPQIYARATGNETEANGKNESGRTPLYHQSGTTTAPNQARSAGPVFA